LLSVTTIINETEGELDMIRFKNTVGHTYKQISGLSTRGANLKVTYLFQALCIITAVCRVKEVERGQGRGGTRAATGKITLCGAGHMRPWRG